MEMKTVTLDCAIIKYDGSKILYIRFLPNKTIDQLDASDIIKAASRLSGDTVHANLVDARSLFYMTDSAKKYFAQTDRTTLVASAILTKSLLQISMANIYLTVFRPKIPTKMFNDPTKAEEWLLSKF